MSRWLELGVGYLCRVLPLGGPVWMNRLVIITEVIDVGSYGRDIYRIVDKDGNSTTLPYYSLEPISTHQKT